MGSKLSLYADNVLLYKPIRVDGDYADLQSDIDSLNNLVSSNHLDFNTSKCKFMLIMRKNKPSHPPPVRLQSSGLEWVESIKDCSCLQTFPGHSILMPFVQKLKN